MNYRREVKMGSEQRAKIFSDRFKNKTLQAIALYGFRSCGNCTNRLKCGEEILAIGKKKAHPLKFIIDTMVTECPKTKFSGLGMVPREVAAFINNECSKCNKNTICIGYLAQHTGYETPEQKQLVEVRLMKCLACEDLGNCVHYFMTQLGISKFSLLRHMFLLKFRKCSTGNEMKISLDLPVGTQGNVLGNIKKEERPKVKTGTEEVK
jgi:positive regulator of sigma E activity